MDIMDALKRSLAAAQAQRRPPRSEKAVNKSSARKRTG
jgi:non-homologous end joining protein Ku